jgi:glycine/sarcosine N-methyltransferase
VARTVRDFYDELSLNYHLIFEDWEASMAAQAAVLGPILVRASGSAMPITILDCACGIGTQALGLARSGFRVTGADLSARAIERARSEASARSLNLRLYVSDMLHLEGVPETGFDAVVCIDNVLPHLSTEDDLAKAATQIRTKLRSGGTFAASIRDYDHLIKERPTVQRPSFFVDGQQRRIIFQLWDWIDERRYNLHLYITCDTPSGWQTQHATSTYRALLRDELTNILERAGFMRVRWMSPAETGFYQPLVLAEAP